MQYILIGSSLSLKMIQKLCSHLGMLKIENSMMYDSMCIFSECKEKMEYIASMPIINVGLWKQFCVTVFFYDNTLLSLYKYD